MVSVPSDWQFSLVLSSLVIPIRVGPSCRETHSSDLRASLCSASNLRASGLYQRALEILDTEDPAFAPDRLLCRVEKALMSEEDCASLSAVQEDDPELAAWIAFRGFL